MHPIGAALALTASAWPALAYAASDAGSQGGLLIVGVIVGLIFLAIYFLPALIGRKRGISSGGALFVVNLLFGWSGIGWFICLLWAATGATRAQDAYYRQQDRTPGADPAADRAYREAYAKERARLDHEAQQRANREA